MSEKRDKYDEKAREVVLVVRSIRQNIAGGYDEMRSSADIIAAFGRECAAEAYDEGAKIAEKISNEYKEDSIVAWNACDDVRLELTWKLRALRAPEVPRG